MFKMNNDMTTVMEKCSCHFNRNFIYIYIYIYIYIKYIIYMYIYNVVCLDGPSYAKAASQVLYYRAVATPSGDAPRHVRNHVDDVTVTARHCGPLLMMNTAPTDDGHLSGLTRTRQLHAAEETTQGYGKDQCLCGNNCKWTVLSYNTVGRSV